MSRSVGCVALLLIVTLLSTVNVPALAVAPEVGVGAGGTVLPQGRVLGNDDLDQVKGKGWGAAITMAAGGALAGLVAYSVDVAWDVYVDGEDREWTASDASKSVATYASGSFVVGLVNARLKVYHS